MIQTDNYKKNAANHAVEFVETGMVVGLGHGSTAQFAILRIAELQKTGDLGQILGIPCSHEVDNFATQLGIQLTTLNKHPHIDLTIDGADEVDPQLNLIKGGGGALLREKIVAQASKREIIIIDENKLSPTLGAKWALPVEVSQFGWELSASFIETLGAKTNLRQSEAGKPFITDSGNYLLDCNFGPIDNLDELASELSHRAGIIEHGLFLGLASDVLVAGHEGVKHLKVS
ncbi:MAG: ribose-5-phosphate isomerase RpiA [Chloroflexi bacterium]|nr:ribose-5-phosphate isomerase RpiA [Chloroflexota bacterium]